MKRLLLLLIIPTISYSQITYEDIMSINSEKTFKRVMIENGFEKEVVPKLEDWIWYGYNINRDGDEPKSSLWGSYDKKNGEFRFQISIKTKGETDLFGRETNSEVLDNSIYDIIVEKIKKNCKYYDIIEKDDNDYVCYSCSQSTYKGKIGFTKIEGFGNIEHIIP
jgi:hypothetical protein